MNQKYGLHEKLKATLYQLLIALFVGLLLVIPCFFFLFKVFKPAEANENANYQ